MRRCIVHFGMNKTGSSSIQASLYNCSLDPKFHYIDLGVDNPSGPLLDAFMLPNRRLRNIQTRSPNLTLEKFNRRRRDPVLEKLRAQLETSTAQTLILSAESLWRLTLPELAKLYQFIRPYVDELQAVTYIRPPKGFMESNFQQLVKGDLKKIDFDVIYPGYRSRFEKFDQVFGPDKVQYWRFAPNLFKGNCVVKDFCTRLNIPIEDTDVRRVNEGLSKEAAAALFAYRKFGARFPARANFNRENAQLVEKLYELPGRKLRFSSKVIAPLLREKREDILWIESRLGASLSEKISQHDEYAIATEADLLSFDQNTLAWFAEQLESDSLGNDISAEKVAGWVHQLRAKLAAQNEPETDSKPSVKPRTVSGVQSKTTQTSINLRKLVRNVQREYPTLKNQIPEKEVLLFVKDVLRQVGRELGDVESGGVGVPGLGKFVVCEQSDDESAKTNAQKAMTFQP